MKQDPEAALSRMVGLLQELPGGFLTQHLLGKVMRPAANQDHAAALAALAELPEQIRTHGASAVLVGWAEAQPLVALEWAAANGVDIANARAAVHFGEYGGNWNSVIFTAMQKDREQTLAWIRAQPPSPGRDAMLAEGLTAVPVGERIRIFEELSPSRQRESVGSVLDGPGPVAPADAEAWTETLPPGDTRNAALRAMGNRLALAYPERIEELMTLWPPGPERDATLEGISVPLSQTDRSEALELIPQIQDTAARGRAYVQLAESWLMEDKNAAQAWIATTSNLTRVQKRVILRQFEEQ